MVIGPIVHHLGNAPILERLTLHDSEDDVMNPILVGGELPRISSTVQ